MTWIQTYTGRKFWPTAPRVEDVCLDDIAHALGNICRFGGNVSKFYSVAEHSLLLSYAVAPENALHALLHDATEAYIGDMVRPLKLQIPQYTAIENRLWDIIADYFDIDPVMPLQVTEYDYRMLLNERAVFMPNTTHRWAEDLEEAGPLFLEPSLIPTGRSPSTATDQFYRRFQELRPGWTPAPQ